MKLLHSTLGILFAGTFALTAATDEAGEEAAEHAVQIDGAKVGEWTMDIDAAKKIAAEKELPLLLNFTGSDWCGWCKIMDKNVFAGEAWKEFAAENVLLVTLDFPRDRTIVPEKYVSRNKDLQKQFGVGGYPTYVNLDSDGETKLGQLGARRDKTPASFIKEFKSVIRMSPAGIEEFVKANPEKAEAYKAGIKSIVDAKKELTDWLGTKPERNDEQMKKFMELQKKIQDMEAALEKI